MIHIIIVTEGIGGPWSRIRPETIEDGELYLVSQKRFILMRFAVLGAGSLHDIHLGSVAFLSHF